MIIRARDDGRISVKGRRPHKVGGRRASASNTAQPEIRQRTDVAFEGRSSRRHPFIPLLHPAAVTLQHIRRGRAK